MHFKKKIVFFFSTPVQGHNPVVCDETSCIAFRSANQLQFAASLLLVARSQAATFLVGFYSLLRGLHCSSWKKSGFSLCTGNTALVTSGETRRKNYIRHLYIRAMSVFKCLERADYTFCSGCQRCLTRVELPSTSVVSPLSRARLPATKGAACCFAGLKATSCFGAHPWAGLLRVPDSRCECGALERSVL